ncbi:hypothetical protein BV20DRAFT_912614, partial [Pilatotrama ljubarskyi]
MGDIKLESMPVLSSASQYNAWAAKMKGYLMFMNCWDVVDGSKRRPADAHAEAQKEWDKLNAQARGLIHMRTTTNFHFILETKTTIDAQGGPTVTTTSAAVLTAKEMWDALKAKFGKPNSAHVWSLFESLISDSRMTEQRPLQDQMS